MNHSFSWKNNSPFYQKVTFYLAVRQLTGIWVALPFVLLGMMLLWSFKLKFFYARVFAAVLGGTAGSCGNCFTFCGTVHLFYSSGAVSFPSTGSSFPTASGTLVITVLVMAS